MKFLCIDAQLSRDDYTNHSIRHTVLSTLDQNNFGTRHIIALSGHKSEATIRQYTKQCPANKKKQMSKCLAEKIIPSNESTNTTVTKTETQNNPPPLQNLDQNIPLQLVQIDANNNDDDLLLKYLESLEKPRTNPSDNLILENTTINNTSVTNNMTKPMLPTLSCNILNERSLNVLFINNIYFEKL